MYPSPLGLEQLERPPRPDLASDGVEQVFGA
jgi:hypothetical protein